MSYLIVIILEEIGSIEVSRMEKMRYFDMSVVDEISNSGCVWHGNMNNFDVPRVIDGTSNVQ